MSTYYFGYPNKVKDKFDELFKTTLLVKPDENIPCYF